MVQAQTLERAQAEALKRPQALEGRWGKAHKWTMVASKGLRPLGVKGPGPKRTQGNLYRARFGPLEGLRPQRVRG